MKNTKESLFKYLAVMIATELMINVPELDRYHEIPEELQQEINKATENMAEVFMKVDKYAKNKKRD